MSYSEQDGQVVLTLSREDYQILLTRLGATRYPVPWHHGEHWQFCDRLNQGNPAYTPYQVR